MEFLKHRIEAEGATFDLADWKNQVPELVSPTINILMMDAEGKLLATSIEHPPRSPLSFSDRQYFQAHRDNPNLGFLIGQPYIGRTAKRLIISATRRLETRNARFARVLPVSIAP